MGDDRFIGVFDSGIGGLTVLKELVSALPTEKIIYLGDTARVPYGSRSRSTIIEYTLEAGEFLRRLDVKLMVLACNTVTTVAMHDLAKHVEIPLIEVVRPTARLALKRTKNKRIGVIGTRATIASLLYTRVLQDWDPEVQVFERSTPLLVPIVEEGGIRKSVIDTIIKCYLDRLMVKDIDTLILGCTHYPLLMDAFERVTEGRLTLINGAGAVAEEVKRVLAEGNMSGSKGPHLDFYLTSMPRSFERQVNRMFSGGIIDGVIETGL